MDPLIYGGSRQNPREPNVRLPTMPQVNSGPSLVRLASLAAFAAAVAVVSVWWTGLEVHGLRESVAIVALFALVAWLRPAFRYCFASFAVYVAFSSAFIILLYALATSRWALADPGLASFDALTYIDANLIATKTNSSLLLRRAMFIIYFTAIPQTLFLIVWYGFRHDPRLGMFLYRYMICGLITAACFYFVPALGAAGTNTVSWNTPAAHDLLALRSGELTVVDCGRAAGIVTFPSFHAIWAILLMFAMPNRFMVTLNVLMFFSAITTGGHYIIDLIGAVLVCGFVVPMTARQFAEQPAAVTATTSEVGQMASA